MRASPRTMSIFYFILGILFIYLAIQRAEETMWNFSTIALAAVAAIDFGVGIRFLTVHSRSQNKEQK